jgi:hypothetical protein
MDGTDEAFPYSCYNDTSRIVPLVAVSSNKSKIAGESKGPGSKTTKFTRYQLPILVAHARTGHSIQGYTAHDGVVIDVGSSFYAGEYVAVSRATELEKVMILEGYTERHFDKQLDYKLLVQQEYLRLSNAFDSATFLRNVTKRSRKAKAHVDV